MDSKGQEFAFEQVAMCVRPRINMPQLHCSRFSRLSYRDTAVDRSHSHPHTHRGHVWFIFQGLTQIVLLFPPLPGPFQAELISFPILCFVLFVHFLQQMSDSSNINIITLTALY